MTYLEPLIAFIAGQPGMAARLMTEHVDDGHGRCARAEGEEPPIKPGELREQEMI